MISKDLKPDNFKWNAGEDWPADGPGIEFAMQNSASIAATDGSAKRYSFTKKE
jgi:hypothetical protein